MLQPFSGFGHPSLPYCSAQDQCSNRSVERPEVNDSVPVAKNAQVSGCEQVQPTRLSLQQLSTEDKNPRCSSDDDASLVARP